MNEEALKHVFNHEGRCIGNKYIITGAGGENLNSLSITDLFKMYKKTYNKKGNYYERP